MNYLKSTLILLLSMSLLSCFIAPDTFADSKKKIGRISITFNSRIGMKDEGSNIEVTTTGNNTNYYYVDNVEVINNDEGGWTNSNPPEVKITLAVEDEEAYYFSESSSSDFKLALSDSAKSYYDKIKFIDVKRKDSNATLILTVQLLFDKDADTSRANAPSYAKWDSSMNGKGNWSDVNSSKYYQIQLIKDGNEMQSVLSIYNTVYDFSSSMTQPGSYCFKVRSVKNSNNAKSQWITSNIMVVDQEGIRRIGGDLVGEGWKRAEDGTRWWWRNVDGTYPVSQWKNENEKWYYFNDQGYMETGWINLNGVYYYLDKISGEMFVNRWTPDNYWVNKEGIYVPQV